MIMFPPPIPGPVDVVPQLDSHHVLRRAKVQEEASTELVGSEVVGDPKRQFLKLKVCIRTSTVR